MKSVIFLILSLLSIPGLAYDDCKYADIETTLKASRLQITPPTIVVRQNDKICLHLQTVDGSPQLVTIQGLPVALKAFKNQDATASFIVRKTGTFTINCGGCSFSASKLIVQDSATFNAQEDQYYRFNSHLDRRDNYQPGTTQRPRYR